MATVLPLPPRQRAEAAGRDMTRTVIDVLNAIRDVGGIEAFDTVAKHLLSPERLYHLLDLIETMNTPGLVRQHRDEFKNQ